MKATCATTANSMTQAKRLGSAERLGSSILRVSKSLGCVVALLGLSAVTIALLAAPSALAEQQHVFLSAFGKEGSGAGEFINPTAAAVNDTSGDVYVVDRGNNRVEYFSATGAFEHQFNGTEVDDVPAGAGNEAPAKLSEPDGIAVDNACSLSPVLSGTSCKELDPSNGDVYVYDAGNHVIDKFDATGKYLSQIKEAETGTQFTDGLDGIATDQNGTLWVYQATGKIDSFSNATTNMFLSMRTDPSPHGPARGLAVDTEDNLYLLQPALVFEKRNVSAELLVERLDNDESTAAAVDLSSNDVYVYNQTAAENSIARFSPAPSCVTASPCVEPPVGSLLERFSAAIAGKPLSAGAGLAVSSTSKAVYAVASASDTVAIFDAVVVPDVTTGIATNVTPSSATVNGTVNPNGVPLTTCRFEYGETEGYGQSVPCEPDAAEVGAGGTPVAVHADISGLSPATVVHFRLVAENANNVSPSRGADQHFTVPGAGHLTAWVADVTADSATLHATVDPNNAPTGVFFEYGITTGYGATIPGVPASIGAKAGGREAPGEHIQDLTPDTTYHYRVVALSELTPGHTQEFTGEDHTFTTQGAADEATLPDGRQWELVSPVDKHGAQIQPLAEGVLTQAAADGEAITYIANAPTSGDAEGDANNVQVLAGRSSSGWSSHDIAVPNATPTGVTLFGSGYEAFSADLSRSALGPIGGFLPLSPAASEQTAYLRSDFLPGHAGEPCTAECYEPLVTGCPSAGPCAKAIEEHADIPPGTVFGNGQHDGLCAEFQNFECRPRVVIATPNLEHIVLWSAVDLTGNGPAPFGGEFFEWTAGRLQLVGALGGLGLQPDTAVSAISPDGSRIVFRGESEGLSGLLLRDTRVGRTVRLDAPETACLGAHQCSNERGTVEVSLVTTDAGRVFFTDTQPLTTSAGASQGPSLYECAITEREGAPQCNLTDLTPLGPHGEPANADGVLGASVDGAWLYYVAGPENAPRVYLRHGGATTSIATLAGGDRTDWGERLLDHTADVSPDGRWLAFMSEQSLTGYDTSDAKTGVPDEEVYLYDGVTGDLVCASCNPSGARPEGIEYGAILNKNDGLASEGGFDANRGIAAIVPPGTSAGGAESHYQPRYLSDSGRLFFDGQDALVPSDVNGTMDVYEYEPVGVPAGSTAACSVRSATFSSVSGGCVGLISSGVSSRESAFLDASESGADVFFLTYSGLSPGDIDGERDVYDAHECSAAVPCFAAQTVAPPACVTADGCKPAPSPQPAIFGPPSSATFSGLGNVLAPPPPAAASPKALTRVQKLARTLKVCHKRRGAPRRRCEAQARKRYGPRSKAKHASTGRKGSR